MIDWDAMVALGGASWVKSANDPDGGFPLDSLPYCIFAGLMRHERPGVGIGDQILDLDRTSRSGLLEGLPAPIHAACESRTLNKLMACDASSLAAFRGRLTALLSLMADPETREAVSAMLSPMSEAKLLKPVEPANYTDFYASIHHATNVGRIFRPDQPLQPNYKFVPIGYHGRASSIVVSGTPVRRPRGQTKPIIGGIPESGPTRSLDYELEVGLYIGEGNALGEPIGIGDAGDHIFGVSLVNDWSARDIQSWEYQPLGPFLGKNFATSVSPWVVPMAALKPYRVAARLRVDGEPDAMDYLWNATDQYKGAINITVEAYILTEAMRAEGAEPYRLSHANLSELYWTPAQLIAHHTSNGCNLLPGDLVATGTVSGAAEDSAGCLLELTHGGGKAVLLPNGERRTALEDGDEVILRGFLKREGYPRITLGECRGLVLPAHEG